MERALARITAPVLTLAIDSDTLYPPYQQELIHETVASLGGEATHVEISSPDGHDAFLLEADAVGLVHQVVAPDELDAAVQTQLNLLSKAGPVAAASAKVLVREVHAALDDRDGLDRANAGLIAALRASDEGREGLTAFLEKRPPRWTAQ